MSWVQIKPGRYRWVDKNTKEEKKGRYHHIIPDIEPYKAVAGDMAGKHITSRSKHREFLKRNGFEEVGNESKYFFRNNGRTDDSIRSERAFRESIREDLARGLSRRFRG